MIEVSHFTKRYGDFVAVDDLSFSIGKGEIFGFIGPNGAGKSTTIRFLATLLRPTAGEGRVAGHSVTTEPMAVRRVIGFMPDDFGVYDGMKVWEFLDFFAVAYEIPRSYRKKIIGEVLELLELSHKKDDYVNGLSKGMKQRLCLAKTLVHDPPVLILDEPASGLDPRARLEMKALLNELKQMGKTILISSHILSELADFCTSIGIIERGKMLAAGSIQEIQQQIRSHRVIKVRVLDESTDRAALLMRDDPSISTVETYDHMITAQFEGQDPDMARLLDRLVHSGVVVQSFAEEPLSLEEVFMMITKGIVSSRRTPMFRDNPVLTRELLVTLRSSRSFILQLLYVCVLGALVFFQWPAGEQGARQVSPGVARTLFDIFFLGQFFLVALMAPTFAAGSITGEKERKTYELLLASPLRPSTILVGKLLSSLSYLVILIVSSLPLMILCYLLGGLLLSEITRSYLVLILAAGTFGLLSIACSSYFRRTSSALVVSYLVILPLAVLCVVLTRTDDVVARDFVSLAILPPWCLASWTVLGILINRRLLHPPDVGSEGKDVVDEEEEMKYAIGVVIDRDLFPDKLFAPAKRTDLMPDGTNPVLDKELRSEIFSQGTLMLRVVIQVSMVLSIPLMAVLLFLRSDKAAYYVAYVLTFNLLVGPVFSAGSITQERERQTLALLLTTLLRPGQIVFAKLMAALRVSTVLTFLLTEQMLLAYALLPELRDRFWTLLAFLLIIATSCLATSTIGLMCSALARRTSTAMVFTYLTLLALFVAPLGIQTYLQTISSVSEEQLAALSVTSPFAAAMGVPMHTTRNDVWSDKPLAVPDPVLVKIYGNFGLPVWAIFLCIYPPLCLVFLGVTYLAFRWRWWRAGGLG